MRSSITRKMTVTDAVKKFRKFQIPIHIFLHLRIIYAVKNIHGVGTVSVEQKLMEKCTHKKLSFNPGSHGKKILHHRLSEKHLWQHPLFCLY